MAQLLLIKTANTPMKTVGDVVNIREDDHIYSEYEKQAFNILQIQGTKADVETKLAASTFPVERIIKTNTTPNQWSFVSEAEKSYAWQDRDSKWYHLDAPPKFPHSTSGLVVEDITILETIGSGLARDSILRRMVVNPGEWNALNTVEIKELNG